MIVVIAGDSFYYSEWHLHVGFVGVAVTAARVERTWYRTETSIVILKGIGKQAATARSVGVFGYKLLSV